MRRAISIAWFVVGLAAVVATEIEYGWRSPTYHHPLHLTAYVVLMSWLYFGTRAIERRK